MDSAYIDQFFNTGVLRISSFKRFREYPDEIRGDKSEGDGSIAGKGGDGFTFHVMTGVGNNSYMLSTSLEESDSIMKDFEVDSYFLITDPLGFSAAVSNSLAGFQEAFLGFCNYQTYRIIDKEISPMTVNDFTNEEGNFIIGHPKMNERIGQLVGNGIDLLYLKEKKYQSQAEFRFVWNINETFFQMNEYLDIVCKEALQHCRRKEGEQDAAANP
jgi:hypothetical protein